MMSTFTLSHSESKREGDPLLETTSKKGVWKLDDDNRDSRTKITNNNFDSSFFYLASPVTSETAPFTWCHYPPSFLEYGLPLGQFDYASSSSEMLDQSLHTSATLTIDIFVRKFVRCELGSTSGRRSLRLIYSRNALYHGGCSCDSLRTCETDPVFTIPSGGTKDSQEW